MLVPVIGLEIHVQANTKTKMFSRVSANYFQTEPNSSIDPVSFGLPGSLPVPNKSAFEKAVTLAIALNCKINLNTKFDRKHYFYPDLPKGYQISQYDKPIGEGGYVEIETGDDTKRIRLQRMHLEEDTGKSQHMDNGKTYLDYNKAGVPLFEIVTRPEFESVEEVLLFAKRLRQIVRYTKVSDARMERGQMRFELNISLRPEGQKELPNYKVEVKNIGSISVLEKVLTKEIKRQKEILEKGEKVTQETRGLLNMDGDTISLRTKEESAGYRYFPEPDIPPINIPEEYLSKLIKNMPVLPVERKRQLLELGLELEQADIFVEDIARGEFFLQVLELVEKPRWREIAKEISKWVNGDLAGLLLKNNSSFEESPVKASDINYLVTMIQSGKISGSIAKKVLEDIFALKKTAEEIVLEKDLIQIQDDSLLEGIVEQIISENRSVVADIAKNPNAMKFLVGQIMRHSKGKANPQTASQLLEKKLPKL